MFIFIILSFYFTHVHCNGNVVADYLARKARNSDGCQVWTLPMPEDIIVMVSFDKLPGSLIQGRAGKS